MSKNKVTDKATPAWKHVVEKESGSRDAYLTMSDEQTTFGTGNYEMVLRAMGCEDLSSGNYWKKGSRKDGARIDGGRVMVNAAKALIFNDNTAFLQTNKASKELMVLNFRWWTEIGRPEMRAVQQQRGNPQLRKMAKSIEQVTNELAHYEAKPEELRTIVEQQQSSLLSHIDSEEVRTATVDAMCKKFIADRKEFLKKS